MLGGIRTAIKIAWYNHLRAPKRPRRTPSCRKSTALQVFLKGFVEMDYETPKRDIRSYVLGMGVSRLFVLTPQMLDRKTLEAC